MTETTESANPNIIDSLLHPLAQPIRKLLSRSGRQELNKILIDDEENILEALKAGVKIESVYFAGEETLSENFKGKLPKDIPVHEVAKRT
jgi:tRNA G18 (ribose-2'-O)-methylase SpoU